MGLVAGGISEALITTETGLVIALPGLFLQYQLGRGLDSYRAFLAHLETVCAQTLYRRARRERDAGARRAAAARIAALLANERSADRRPVPRHFRHPPRLNHSTH
jgi:hypothetical protein